MNPLAWLRCRVRGAWWTFWAGNSWTGHVRGYDEDLDEFGDSCVECHVRLPDHNMPDLFEYD